MKTPKFKTKTGLLTVYAFACGYIEKFEHDKKEVTLDMEHGVFSVKAYDHNKGERICWENFERNELKKARKFYNQIKRQIQLKKYKVEFTDTFGGDANYSWVERYEIEALSFSDAITQAKRERYWSPLPRHITSDYGDQVRIDIVGACVCAFIDQIDE